MWLSILTFPFLDEEDKMPLPPGYWENKENRRQFLLDFAAKLNFDPMVESNWNRMAPKLRVNMVYHFCCCFINVVNIHLFTSFVFLLKGGGILRRYSGWVPAMLADTFPEFNKNSSIGKCKMAIRIFCDSSTSQ